MNINRGLPTIPQIIFIFSLFPFIKQFNFQSQTEQNWTNCQQFVIQPIQNELPLQQPQQQHFMPISGKPFPSILEQAIQMVESPDTMKDIDALVHSRAVDLLDSSMDDDSSSTSGSSTSCFSPRSETTADDSDWTPKSVSQLDHKSSGSAALKTKESSKRKPRLNRRSVEDRQSRKKEQNKNAANRYRMKKKEEIEIILVQERELAKRNEALQAEYREVCRETKYLKSLLRELYDKK